MENYYERPARRCSAGRRVQRRKETWSPRAKRRLIQLCASVAVFLMVFLGRGILPAEMSVAGKTILTTIRSDTDFGGAFTQLGESVAGGDKLLDAVSAFCVTVFGTEGEGDAVLTMGEIPDVCVSELEFLQAEPTLHSYVCRRLWLEDTGKTEEVNEVEQTAAVAQTEIVPVGSVIRETVYDGEALPADASVQVLSLGALETTTPVMAPLTSGFGWRIHPTEGVTAFHYGADLAANTGTTFVAFADGTVELVKEDPYYGLYLKIAHENGIETVYAHCNRIYVSEGQTVTKGECIGEIGETGNATGPHLHFEVWLNGIAMDPMNYIEQE